jgi:hypothetical protein
MTLFFGKPISEVGSPYFITHSFYTFTVLTGYLITILGYGAQANDIDNKIKDDLIKVQVDINEAIILTNKDRVWEKDGQIHIMTKTDDGKFVSLRDDKVYDNLDDFVSKKEEVEENTGILAEQVQLGIDRMDYKLENQQLSIFGQIIDYDMLYNVVTLYIGGVGSVV